MKATTCLIFIQFYYTTILNTKWFRPVNRKQNMRKFAKIGFLYAEKNTELIKVHHRRLWQLWLISSMSYKWCWIWAWSRTSSPPSCIFYGINSSGRNIKGRCCINFPASFLASILNGRWNENLEETCHLTRSFHCTVDVYRCKIPVRIGCIQDIERRIWIVEIDTSRVGGCTLYTAIRQQQCQFLHILHEIPKIPIIIESLNMIRNTSWR